MSKDTQSVNDRSINSTSRFRVNEHVMVSVPTFVENRENPTTPQKGRPSRVTRSPAQQAAFNNDLCEALLAASIPLRRISNDKFRKFLEKYTGKSLPTESTLRDQYVEGVFQTVIEVIRMGIGTNKIWVSVDETCDVQGRFVANVVVGILRTGGPGHAYLLHSEETDAGTDPLNVCKLIDMALRTLWSGMIYYDRVLLFLTDATPRMTKAGDLLRTIYPKMVHATCAAHGVHKAVEDIRDRFNTVDDLMSDVSKILRNSPASLVQFKTVAPGTELPPDPSLTGLVGGWLDAAVYYCDNYDTIVRFISSLDESNTVNVRNVKLCLSQPRLREYLTYIKSNFESLSGTIELLQNRDVVPLVDSLKIIDRIAKIFSDLKDPHADGISNKLDKALRENAGLNALRKISKMIDGNERPTGLDLLARGLMVDDLLYFKYAPITSTNVERLFPAYKTVLSDDREPFKNFDYVQKHLIIQCNSRTIKEQHSATAEQGREPYNPFNQQRDFTNLCNNPANLVQVNNSVASTSYGQRENGEELISVADSARHNLPDFLRMTNAEYLRLVLLMNAWRMSFLSQTLKDNLVDVSSLRFITPCQCEQLLAHYPLGIRLKFIGKVLTWEHYYYNNPQRPFDENA